MLGIIKVLECKSLEEAREIANLLQWLGMEEMTEQLLGEEGREMQELLQEAADEALSGVEVLYLVYHGESPAVPRSNVRLVAARQAAESGNHTRALELLTEEVGEISGGERHVLLTFPKE